ncbi:MAG TPA: carboxynorspermidine decarboxylase [Candidatus Borkfalkia faecipullorum]|uniref:Carboxynorspermidine decarboxylase n=1 Tax=Candidatus Borkfalkia faecipullorum TaxID=2838510 RepID=A0A9D1V6H8_9FIRM|nr:carboxynorspermidine decarboxylase [Candidatus Borkfalkia faecipullorum]
MNTPYFLIEEEKLEQNLRLLRSVAERAGCKILLAQKAYSVYQTYPTISNYLDGSTASGVYEARLGREEFGKEVHAYSPAFREEDVKELASLCDHIVFNTPAQVKKYAPLCKKKGVSVGLRINPECSTQEGHAIYDPCAPGSRLGTTLANFDESVLPLLDGLHFHTLCEQNSDDLEVTVRAFCDKFGKYLPRMKWLNLGGGHHITRADYDVDRLVRIVRGLKERYGVQVYLEPGEAVVLNAGTLHARVLDTLHNGLDIAILDVSAACHMPDVLEMPYRPPLFGSGEAGEKAYTYRLAGPTCLAGDVIGDYSFDSPLKEGDELVFGDMALYTMVKTNTFNGMPLPAIRYLGKDGKIQTLREFSYEDFKNRL